MRQLDVPRLLSVVIAAVVVTATRPAIADDPQGEEDHDAVAGHHMHNHHIAVFGGATAAEDATAATFGADYEYRFQRWIGATALVDLAFFEHLETILGAGAVVHPVAELKLVAAPGVEIADGHSTFVMRVGAAYDLRIAQFSISPTYNADIADGHVAHVFGAAVGYGL